MQPGIRLTMTGSRISSQGNAFDYTLASTPENVRKTLKAIRYDLVRLDKPAILASAWEIILAEILNNVVEHAYLEKDDGRIQISVLVATDCLCVRVEDHGAAMPGNTLPEGTPQPLDVAVQDLPEGGFGWYLIRSMTRDLRYERSGGRNILHFSVPF